MVVLRHLLGRRSEAAFLTEVRRGWAKLFPTLPHQSEANRRVRWLWRAFEQLRAGWAATAPLDDAAQLGTSALPVKHTSRVRGPDGWTGPNGLVARFGRTPRTASGSTGPPRRQNGSGQPAGVGVQHRAGRGERTRSRFPAARRRRAARFAAGRQRLQRQDVRRRAGGPGHRGPRPTEVKIKLDENLPVPAQHALTERGHEVENPYKQRVCEEPRSCRRGILPATPGWFPLG